MNILQKIIATLNKEESRFYKLFASRTNSKKERKDVLLFDYLKRHSEDYDEALIAKKLYKNNKTAFIHIKNRFLKDFWQSLSLLHHNLSHICSCSHLKSAYKENFSNQKSGKPNNSNQSS